MAATTKNIVDFINDAAKNDTLKTNMINVAKNNDPKKLMDAFHAKGYEDVSLADCKTFLEMYKRDPKMADIAY